MTSQLIIWMGTDPSGPWQWTTSEAGTSEAGTSGVAVSLADKVDLSGHKTGDVCAVVAGQSVHIFAHDLPKLNSKERLTAAGFAIEDEIAGSLNTQHICLGDKDDARVAVITKTKMQAIVSALDAAGFKDAAVYADFDVLSSGGRHLVFGDRVICAKRLGHTLDKSWHDPKETAELMSDPKDLVKFFDEDKAINLRQNGFSSRQSFAFSGAKINIQSLGRLAALLVLCSITWLGLQAVSARAKGQQTAFIKSETARVYTQATGQTVLNPARAAAQALQSAPKQEANFLSLSKLLFDMTAQTDGIIIDTVRYDEARAELSLRIIYPGFGSTTDLENSALAIGAVFEAGGVREQGGQFIGDATLRMGGGS